MDPKTIKLKLASQLDDADKKYIAEHPTEFDDEDRAAWKDVLESTAAPDDNPDDVTPPDDGSVGTPAIEIPPVTPASAVTPVTDTPKTEEAVVFKTKEEAQEFVRKEFERQKQEAMDAAKTPEEKKWVEANWKPKDWNQAFTTTADVVVKILEQRQELKNKQIDEHNKKVEADWQSLRTENKLPDIRNEDGTPNDAGIAVQNAIINIGTKFGKKNFKDAYEVYLMVPKEKGGGYEPTPANPKPPVTPEKTSEVSPSEAAAILAKQRKVAAAKVGGQNAGNSATKGAGAIKAPTYEDLKTKSKAKLIKEALAS